VAGHVENRTVQAGRVLHELTGWALEGGHALPGLSVLRVSLEDVYLGLTRSVGAGAGDEVAAS
jgi:ABC-2 type transport system ATP-binding protein